MADTLIKYDRSFPKYVAKMTKRMNAQMKPHTFNLFKQISIIKLSKDFRGACDTDAVHEGTGMRLFHLFMNKTALTVLDARHDAERTTQC